MTTSSARAGDEQALGDTRAALAEDARDSALPQLAQRLAERNSASGVEPDARHLDPGRGGEILRLGLRDALAGDDQRRRLARGGGEARAARQAQTRVQNHAQRLETLKSRQAHGEQRIVDRGRAMADHDRAVQRSLNMGDRIGERAGDEEARIMVRPGGVAVRRLGELQSDHRPPLRHPQYVAEMIGAGLHGAHAGRRPRRRPRATAHGRGRRRAVRVLERGDDPRDAGGEDRVHAGRRRAVMRARLQRDVERRAARRLAGRSHGDGLGVRAAAQRRVAARDDDAVLDDQRANRRIRPRAAEIAPAERQRRRHEGVVRNGLRFGFRLRRGHLPPGAVSASCAVSALCSASLCDNSSISAWKSPTSRKSR